MTDLPKEDRDLIERVLGAEALWALVDDRPVRLFSDEIAELLAAARSEGPARAPVVDDAAVDRAIAAVNGFGPHPMALEERRRALMRAALLAALGASQ